jgi:hypothetical protein
LIVILFPIVKTMTANDSLLLSDYSREVGYQLTVASLIAEHQKLIKVQADFHRKVAEAELRGVREGYAIALDKIKLRGDL